MRPNIAGQTKNRGPFIGRVHGGDKMVSRDLGIPTHGFWFSQKIGFNTSSYIFVHASDASVWFLQGAISISININI
jgi:hypothetical protein